MITFLYSAYIKGRRQVRSFRIGV